jgi:hypothetical protein
MSARDDGLTGEVLDKAEPPPPDYGPRCADCGRSLAMETVYIDGWADLHCLPCREVGGEELEE